MWKVFPKLGMLKVLLLIFSALFLAALILMLDPIITGSGSWIDFGVALKLAAPVTLIFLLFIFAIGKWGWLLFWEMPFVGCILNSTVCPNLNGVWSGYIESNFTGEDGNRVKKEVELEIKADLFGFSISQRSLDGYQSSKVTQSEIYKDLRTGTFYISYIYEGNVPIPQESDDRIFDGAGKLEVIIGNCSTVLKGTYWTNRAWQRKKNTAGIIYVSRKNS